MNIKAHAVVLACLVGLTACGPGSDPEPSSDGKQAVTELTKALQVQEGRLRALPPLPKGDAECVAKGLLESPGTDVLVKYEVLNTDMTVNTTRKPLAVPSEPATQMVDSIVACVDLAKMQGDEMAGDDDDPPAVKKCFATVLDEDGVRLILLSGLTGDNKGMKQVNSELQTCIANAGL